MFFSDNVDKQMVLLRFENENGAPIGAMSFFAVHGTSMFNYNRLVCSFDFWLGLFHVVLR